MLAVKNCWALTANQLSSFVQFLPLCLYLPAVAGEFYCRRKSARLAPALWRALTGAQGCSKGLLLPGTAGTPYSASILYPRRGLAVCTSLVLLILVRGYPQFTACKLSPTMLAAFTGDVWRANGMVSQFFHFSKQFHVRKNLIKGYLVWQSKIRKTASAKIPFLHDKDILIHA